MPVGITPALGPISTGLGEIYLWTVEAKDGARNLMAYPHGDRPAREIQDWIIKPAVAQRARCDWRSTRLAVMPRNIQIAPIPARLASLGVTCKTS